VRAAPAYSALVCAALVGAAKVGAARMDAAKVHAALADAALADAALADAAKALEALAGAARLRRTGVGAAPASGVQVQTRAGGVDAVPRSCQRLAGVRGRLPQAAPAARGDRSSSGGGRAPGRAVARAGGAGRAGRRGAWAPRA